MRVILLFSAAFSLWGCSAHPSGPNQTSNGTKGQSTSISNQNGSFSGNKKGTGNQAASANGGQTGVKVPDPHASRNPNLGHEAGVGDDPNDLQVGDPDTGESGSGGRQGHATR